MKYTDPDGREVTPAVPFVLGSEAVGALGTALAGALIELAPAAGLLFTGLFILSLNGDSTSTQRNQYSSDENTEDAGESLINAAAAPCPTPEPDPDDNDDEDYTQSAKDAKKLDNKGADKLAKEKGYKDAHELKKDYVKGQKDKKIDHYNIFNNAKTGQSFLIHNDSELIILLE